MQIQVFRLALLLLFCPAVCFNSFAEPTIQRLLGGLEDSRIILQKENENFEIAAQEIPFSADVLEEAGFRSYSEWLIRPQGRSGLRLNVLEMRDPGGAYQVFSLWPGDESQTPSGLESGRIPSVPDLRTASGSDIFWCGNYFFQALRRSETQQPELSPIAQHLCQSLTAASEYPVTVSHLPEDSRIANSIRFYLGEDSLSLNEHFPEPLLSELGFRDEIEIAYAGYEPSQSHLFLIGYPTPALAAEYSVTLQDRLTNYFSTRGVFLKRTGPLVALFIGTEERALEILGQVKYKPGIKWLYRKQPESLPGEYLTFLGLITKTILGIGFFIVLVAVAGLLTGLARYEFIKRFPATTRRNEMIRLKIDEPQTSSKPH